MRCPNCRNLDTKVIDSRLSPDESSIRRRRECLKCAFRFSTLEEARIFDLTIIKNGGKRQTYNRKKIENGLKRALEKRRFTEEKFKKLIGKIEIDIQKTKKKEEIKSSQIGEIIMKNLKKVDKVAYIRFASVYKSFEDVETFEQEISKLFRKKSKK
ncbi:transcriptional repressor NrdR [Candidatus Parcubacteria bacterium]|nr:transcriptional repressor NrdR [Candidatus Parcubacteria bacterium]